MPTTTWSRRQRLECIIAVVAAVGIVVVGILRQPEAKSPDPSQFTVGMSLKEMAPRLGVTGKSLARELGLPLDTRKSVPVPAPARGTLAESESGPVPHQHVRDE